VLLARLGLGAAQPGFGDLEVEVPAQFAFAIGAGYPISLGPKLLIDLGPTISTTRFPWGMGDVKGNSSLIEVVGNVGLTYAVASKIGVRVDVGAGVLLFTGLQQNNPFTEGGRAANGALTMPHVRAALSGEYLVSDKIAVQVVPIAFGYSPPKNGLQEPVKSLTQLQFMVGLAFRQ
jgi:hypothetical protein